ncbi:MAG: sulfite exporter TauE/SafE family protein [Paraglaciecola sp.]|nr:sulfite exporter TauE/SafE family protein [Paraglaciecola sp.]NCT47789.1 sulfite exporter TauE/SafE family protein [Paraglaciecola sp.]
MNELTFFAALLVGLAGGLHCVVMCGGVVSALSFAIPAGRAHFPYILAYNLGRIVSYTLAGGLCGWLGQLFSHQSFAGINVLQVISSIFLLMLACYIGNWWRGLTQVEKLGRHVWRYISPLGKRFIPFKSVVHALPYGMLWGWLPCGLVYSALTWSLASGNWHSGAWLMLGFGLGTLPVMLLIALGFKQLSTFLQHPSVKQSVAVVLLLMAIFSLHHSLALTPLLH